MRKKYLHSSPISILNIFVSFSLITFGSSEFIGPKPESLLGFWPFDQKSGIDQIAGDQIALAASFKSGAGVLIGADPLGPFGVNGTSHSTQNASLYMIRYAEALFPPSFTISFYFYSGFKKDNSNYKRILKFGQGQGQEFAIGYMGKNLFLDLPYVKANDANSTPYWSAFTTNKWSFVAISYDNPTKQLKVFDASGLTLLQATLPRTLPTWIKGLAIGSIERKDRIACLTIYKEVLNPSEIQKLPCVCATRGQCSDGSSFRKKPYPGPLPENLMGFWPLTDDFGGSEMTTGQQPASFQARKLRTSTLTGPFRRPLQIFSPYDNGDWVLDSTRLNYSNSTSLTIAFYFHYQNFAEKVDTAIPLLKLGRLSLAFADRENVVMVLRDSFNTVLNAADLLQVGNWKFIALSYDRPAQTVRFHDEWGRELMQFHRIDLAILAEPTSDSEIELSIGPTRRRMGMACLSIFNESLEPAEIAQLRCACLQVVEPASKKVPQCPEPVSDLGIVAIDQLNAYWPLDNQSALNDIANAMEDTGATVGERLLADELGPFQTPGTSYSIALAKKWGDRLGAYRFNFGVPSEFTFSFYFYKGSLKSNGTILALRQHPARTKLPLLALRYSQKSLFVDFLEQSIVLNVTSLEMLVDEWIFLAVTYSHSQHVLTLHRQSGDLVDEYENVTLSDYLEFGEGVEHGLKTDQMDLWFGPIQNVDRMACVMFWRRVLTETEVARIPCACRTRGRCPDHLAVDRHPGLLDALKDGLHAPQNLIGFWPFNRRFGLAEAARGFLPSFISREARLDSIENGPFDVFETSYSLGIGMASESSLIEYNLGSNVDPYTWTILFYLFIDDKSPGGETICIYQGSEDNSLLSVQYTARTISVETSNVKRRDFKVQATRNGWVFATLTFERDSNKNALYTTFYTNSEANFSSPLVSTESRIPAVYRPLRAGANVTLSIGRRLRAVDCLACLTVWNGVALHGEAIRQLPELCEFGRIATLASTPQTPRRNSEIDDDALDDGGHVILPPAPADQTSSSSRCQFTHLKFVFYYSSLFLIYILFSV